MSDRLQAIREAVKRDVSNGETAYADRAWLLRELDKANVGITDVSKQLADEKKACITALRERDQYGQRWRHWEIQANALLPDAEAWREHQRHGCAVPYAGKMQEAAERMVQTFRDWMAGCANETRWKEVEAAHINLRDALNSPQVNSPTSEGWALVPFQPTPLMLRAAHFALANHPTRNNEVRAREVWTDMIGAAPVYGAPTSHAIARDDHIAGLVGAMRAALTELNPPRNDPFKRDPMYAANYLRTALAIHDRDFHAINSQAPKENTQPAVKCNHPAHDVCIYCDTGYAAANRGMR